MSRNSLCIAAQSGWPVLLKAGPGVGKSKYSYSLGDALSRHVETLLLSTCDPADVTGLPFINKDDQKVTAKPQWFRNLQEDPGILFLDELSTAAPAVQAPALRVVNELAIEDEKMHPDTMVIAAANPADIAAGGWELAPPLANRFFHVDWVVDQAEWVDGFLSGFPTPEVPVLPDNWRSYVGEKRALVAGYIRSRPEFLYKLPDAEVDQGSAWPSPRTWDMLADLMGAAQSVRAGADTVIELATGSVGSGQGFEFVNYVENLDLPDPEELLKDPDSFQLPARGDQQYAVLGAITARTIANLTNDRWMAAWKIMHIAAEDGAVDVATGAARDLAHEWKKGSGLDMPKQELQPFVEVLKESGILEEAR